MTRRRRGDPLGPGMAGGAPRRRRAGQRDTRLAHLAAHHREDRQAWAALLDAFIASALCRPDALAHACSALSHAPAIGIGHEQVRWAWPLAARVAAELGKSATLTELFALLDTQPPGQLPPLLRAEETRPRPGQAGAAISTPDVPSARPLPPNAAPPAPTASPGACSTTRPSLPAPGRPPRPAPPPARHKPSPGAFAAARSSGVSMRSPRSSPTSPGLSQEAPPTGRAELAAPSSRQQTSARFEPRSLRLWLAAQQDTYALDSASCRPYSRPRSSGCAVHPDHLF